MASVVAAWPTVALGEVLRVVSRPVAVQANQMYPLLGMHWYAEGLYIKDRKLGSQIQANTLYEVRRGDFVYNRLFGWKGSFGIADENADGCYASNEFPCFHIDDTRLYPSFLRWYFAQESVWEHVQLQSSGSTPTSRLRLKEAQFLALDIPLPPLEEQRRIVSRIEALAALIAEARGLRQAAVAAAKQLLEASIERALGSVAAEEVELEDIMAENSLNGLSEHPSSDPIGTPILRISAGTSRADGVVDEADVRYLVLDDATVTKYMLQRGDLVACRFNGNLSNVGKFALYEGYSGLTQIFPDKLIRFRIDWQLAMPAYVCMAMNSASVRQRIEAFCATTAGNIGISAGNLKTVNLPLPSIQDQERVVAQVRVVRAQIDCTLELQGCSDRALDALLPSVLDRAFRGEL